MKTSARNLLNATVITIKKGPFSSIITLEITPGVEIAFSATSDPVKAFKSPPNAAGAPAMS